MKGNVDGVLRIAGGAGVVSGAGVLTWECNPQLLAILQRAQQARQEVRERLKPPVPLSP
jgi:hypothetical protein